MPADLLTPISCYLKWSKLHKNSFLFESVLAGEKIGRYSFIGCNPRKLIQTHDKDPLMDLEAELHLRKPVKVSGLPEFYGGAIGLDFIIVGYIGYDCIRYFEPSTERPLIDILQIPESVLMFCDSIVIFDHLFSVIKVVTNILLDPGSNNIAQKYDEAISQIKSIVDLLESTELKLPVQPPIISSDTVSNIGKEGYEKLVVDLKKNIAQGDIIQAVPSQRVSKKTNLHPFNAYRMLRTVNPAPYMFYIGSNH
jgi:anthranilate synthase component 1